MPSEAQICGEIINWINTPITGNVVGFAYKTHGDQYTPSGIPDIVAVIDGRHWAIEVKDKPGEKPSMIQWFVGTQIIEAGGIAFMAYSLENVQRAVGLWRIGGKTWELIARQVWLKDMRPERAHATR